MSPGLMTATEIRGSADWVGDDPAIFVRLVIREEDGTEREYPVRKVSIQRGSPRLAQQLAEIANEGDDG